MATLSIRNIPEEDHKALRIRAAHKGRSMEAEARIILHQALQKGEESGMVRRAPPATIAGKGITLGDLVSPMVDERDWECLK